VRRTSLAVVTSTVTLVTLGVGFTGAASAHSAAGPALKVGPLAGRHPISRDIYGMNFAPASLERQLKLPEARWGGNATTRYNYRLDTANHASDWYFENIPNTDARPGALPNGSTADQFIGRNRRHGTGSIITVPLIGWTPKARAQACGFSVAKYGPQQSTDPYDSDCGNGVTPSGSYITGDNPADTSKHAGSGFVAGWVRYLDHRYGNAAHGGVRFYQFDNEPDIWFATHRDVHPVGATYGQMLRKTESIGAAIKAADPAAQTIGPSGWGWSSLFYSGYDQQYCSLHTCGPVPPDMARHGGVPFTTWYLRKLRAYQHKTGKRLLDYFDNHWYPQEANVDTENDSPATQALRLRSTRMLWDPHYVDQSWINKPVMAIPRMKQLVARNYPGTKVAITEYNWGALDKMDGGLAEADVLGIFGREGVDLATLWGPPKPTNPAAFAFRMYLNYDGKGSAFGSTSVRATSAAQGKLSIYAAQRSTGHALTIIVINKTHHGLTSPLSVTGLAASATAQVYQYGQAHPKAIVRKPAQAFKHGAATVTFPGYSITEFVVPASGLTRAAAGLRPATGAVAASAAVPATGAGPADGFLRAVRSGGMRVAGGWNPNAVRRCHSDQPSLTGAGCDGG
jgi:Glycoside hydrolase family 44